MFRTIGTVLDSTIAKLSAALIVGSQRFADDINRAVAHLEKNKAQPSRARAATKGASADGITWLDSPRIEYTGADGIDFIDN